MTTQAKTKPLSDRQGAETHRELSKWACDGFRSFCAGTAALTPDHPLMRPDRDPEPARVIRERTWLFGRHSFEWRELEGSPPKGAWRIGRYWFRFLWHTED